VLISKDMNAQIGDRGARTACDDCRSRLCFTSMRSRHRRSARVLMVLTSLVTVWCLECSAFEPLLAALLGARSGVMACGSMQADGAPGGAAGVAEAGSAGATTAHVSEPGHQREAFDCGCGGSCHAPNATASAVASVRVLPPTIAAIDAIQPVSADRAPLLPPPERAVA